MKKLAIGLLTITMMAILIGGGFVMSSLGQTNSSNEMTKSVQSARITCMNKKSGCMAIIYKGGWFGNIGGFYSSNRTSIIIRNYEELVTWVDEIIALAKQDDAIVPDGYWQSIEKQVQDFYSKYNKDFFIKHDLVIALVDQGSGSVQYEVADICVKDNILTLNVTRNAGLIQTMDFISRVAMVEVEKGACDFDAVKVNLINVGPQWPSIEN